MSYFTWYILNRNANLVIKEHMNIGVPVLIAQNIVFFSGVKERKVNEKKRRKGIILVTSVWILSPAMNRCIT